MCKKSKTVLKVTKKLRKEIKICTWNNIVERRLQNVLFCVENKFYFDGSDYSQTHWHSMWNAIFSPNDKMEADSMIIWEISGRQWKTDIAILNNRMDCKVSEKVFNDIHFRF